MPRFNPPLLATVAAVLALGVVGSTLAHDYQAGDLAIDHPWARATAPQQQNGAAYFTVTNSGAADRLLEARSAVAERVELHTHDVDAAGVMRMRQLEAIDLPAGETVGLRPGGLHVMLISLGDRLVEGQSFPLSIVLEKAGTIELEVSVEAVTFGAEGHGGHGQAPAAEGGAGHGQMH